jgi:hypothetical protein
VPAEEIGSWAFNLPGHGFAVLPGQAGFTIEFTGATSAAGTAYLKTLSTQRVSPALQGCCLFSCLTCREAFHQKPCSSLRGCGSCTSVCMQHCVAGPQSIGVPAELPAARLAPPPAAQPTPLPRHPPPPPAPPRPCAAAVRRLRPDL